MNTIHQNKNTTAPHTLSNFQSLTKLIALIINHFYSHCSGDWQIALTKYNPQNEMYQKLKRNVHFLSGG